MRATLTVLWLCCWLAVWPRAAPAWSPDGHRVVGALALGQLGEDTLAALLAATGAADAGELAEACNWPDDYRASLAGAWSSPLHYVNIERGASGYLHSRDCRGRGCVSSAILRYADRLGDAALAQRERWQAWAFTCHFTGDIHQPLHVGFADDRGGNEFHVSVDGQSMDLHDLWDDVLIERHQPDWRALAEKLSARPQPADAVAWEPRQVLDWTNESHELAKTRAYPRAARLDAAFLDASWQLAQDQLALAGQRLAAIARAVLGGEAVNAPAADGAD
ncbi:MAG: hypothetical protein GTN86_08390 [Xanthomonadales bacterium]|nr:hypothetical protein [Xanthomonadales bacterium]NIT46205.1 hypothetical protein [Stutzerimonas stutzeri]NIN59885.1 hypothetical protein [Xanthomonadales bacterium]NIN75259.1 hypothetical protein [Xanthomonadales bacterium]NIO15128.1 hypothetical protein [Xanthomonadales bacterium]